MLRGIRYRAGRSFVVFILATLATTAAVLAPAYSRAAQESVLTDGLARASGDATSVTVGATGTSDGEPAAYTATDGIRLSMNQVLARQPALAARLDRPVAAVDTDAAVGPLGQPLTAKLAYRDQVCNHLQITGACPESPGQVVISQRMATGHNLAPGASVTLHLGPPQGGRDKVFKVTGTYTPKNPNDEYWGATVYFAGGSNASGDGERGDALFTTSEDDLRTEHSATLSTRLEYPLVGGRIKLDDVPALREGITVVSDRMRGDGLDVTTTLPAILDQIHDDQHAISRTAPVIAVPLVLLCWFVLFLLVASLTEERAAEIALAKLRGYPAGRAARFGLGEVLLLIAVATPVGLVAGLVLVQVASGVLLAPGTRVELRWPVFAAAAVALAAGVVATVLAGRSTLAQPVLSLLRRTPARGGWRAGVVEGVAVALAGASIAAAVSDPSSPLALLAAPMLAVVVGIGAARLLGLWSAARLRLARRRGRVASLLAAAQLARRPGGQRVVVVVTVAVALLTFAATAWDVAAEARHKVAEDEVGAQKVLSVATDHPTALLDAVAKADPSGDSMAVVRTSQRYGDASVQLVGVDSAHLANVAVWRGESKADLSALAATLRPAAAAPLAVSQEVYVDATADTLPTKLQLRLAAVVSAPGQPPRSVTLGVLAKGAHQYHATVPGCTADCHLVGLSVGRAAGGSDQFTASVGIRGIHTEAGEVAAGLDQANRWKVRGGTQAQATVHPGNPLVLDVTSADPADVVLDYVDTPDQLPAVLAGRAPADNAAATSFTFPGFAEQPQPFAVTGHVDTLPRAGSWGLLFDLDYAVRMAERTSSLADNEALQYEVWAAPGAPADLGPRLTAQGVQVLRTQTIAGDVTQLERRAPALGLWLYLLAGAAALALAIGVVLLTAYVGVQGRLYELAALRVSGVRRSVLRRAVFREYRALLGLPFLVGLAAGVVGALVMLPDIPLVTVGQPTGAFSYKLGFGALPVAVAATVAGLLVAVLMVVRILRRATPDRLREGAGA
jgi:putative ABC transport system permease protein